MLNKISLRKINFPLSLQGAKQRSNLNHSGFSLIELMVAVAILAMAAFGIFHAYSASFMGMAYTKDITVATNYGQEKMEDFKNGPFENITAKGFAYIPGQTKFEREVNLDGSIIDLKKVTTTVRWKNRKGVYKHVVLVTLVYNL